jgi:hypothetical protein
MAPRFTQPCLPGSEINSPISMGMRSGGENRDRIPYWQANLIPIRS